jgi:hypothetical protein
MRREVKISPRTVVIIENIATVRQIQKYLDDGELRADLLAILKGFEGRIANFFPDVWRKPILNRSGAELLLVPDEAWEVGEGEAVAISVSLGQVLEPYFFDQQDDPFVSIFVPKDWQHSETFAARLENEAPKDWERRRGNAEFDEQYPIWRYVAFSKYASGNDFDVEGFYDELRSAVNILLDIKPQIDRLLGKVKA